MSGRLDGQVALVTGGARGQGRALIRAENDLDDLISRHPQRLRAFAPRRQRHLALGRGSAHQNCYGVGCPARLARHVFASFTPG